MPYVLLSTQVRLELGPTVCGDEFADPALMSKLGAYRSEKPGDNFANYCCDEPPRMVMNRLEKLDFKLVGQSGSGQTIVWTFYREENIGKGGD